MANNSKRLLEKRLMDSLEGLGGLERSAFACRPIKDSVTKKVVDFNCKRVSGTVVVAGRGEKTKIVKRSARSGGGGNPKFSAAADACRSTLSKDANTGKFVGWQGCMATELQKGSNKKSRAVSAASRAKSDAQKARVLTAAQKKIQKGKKAGSYTPSGSLWGSKKRSKKSKKS